MDNCSFKRIRVHSQIRRGRMGSTFPAEGQGLLPGERDTDHSFLRGLRSGRDSPGRVAVRQGVQGGQGKASDYFRHTEFRVAGPVPFHRRELYREYTVCRPVQPCHGGPLLHCGGTHGSGHSPAQGHRGSARDCGHIELCGGRDAGHRKRISHPRLYQRSGHKHGFI